MPEPLITLGHGERLTGRALTDWIRRTLGIPSGATERVVQDSQGREVHISLAQVEDHVALRKHHPRGKDDPRRWELIPAILPTITKALPTHTYALPYGFTYERTYRISERDMSNPRTRAIFVHGEIEGGQRHFVTVVGTNDDVAAQMIREGAGKPEQPPKGKKRNPEEEQSTGASTTRPPSRTLHGRRGAARRLSARQLMATGLGQDQKGRPRQSTSAVKPLLFLAGVVALGGLLAERQQRKAAA